MFILSEKKNGTNFTSSNLVLQTTYIGMLMAFFVAKCTGTFIYLVSEAE